MKNSITEIGWVILEWIIIFTALGLCMYKYGMEVTENEILKTENENLKIAVGYYKSAEASMDTKAFDLQKELSKCLNK